MQKSSGNKIRLGVFVTIGLLLLIVGIYFIGKKQQLFDSTFQISGVFKDINGLQIGNNVRFSGINVGIVEEINQISDSTVMVEMMIDEKTRKFMKKNVKAVIGSDGLMGNKIVTIIPGKKETQQLVNNDIIQTTQPISMDDILLKLKITGDNAANITGDLAVIMKNIREGKGTVGKLFSDTVFAKTVDEALVNIKQGAGGFKQNMNAASKNILLRGFFKKKKKENNDKKED